MSILNQEGCLIIIIDVQEKLLNAMYNKEAVKKKAGIIAQAAKILGMPVIVTEQYPKGLGETVIKDVLPPDTKIFEKSAFSALDEEEIFDYVKNSNCHQMVILGIETHICVNQTVNSLLELGYEVSVISDGCGSRDVNEHNAGIDKMRGDGANILTAETALFEWIKTSKHPHFKEIQALIK